MQLYKSQQVRAHITVILLDLLDFQSTCLTTMILPISENLTHFELIPKLDLQSEFLKHKLLKNLKFDEKYVLPTIKPKKHNKGFFLGQVVLIKNLKISTLPKGGVKFEGPYVVTARVGVNSYKVTHLATGNKIKFVINGRRMSPYKIEDKPVIVKKKQLDSSQVQWIHLGGRYSTESYKPPHKILTVQLSSKISSREVRKLNQEAEKWLQRNATGGTERSQRSGRSVK